MGGDDGLDEVAGFVLVERVLWWLVDISYLVDIFVVIRVLVRDGYFEA